MKAEIEALIVQWKAEKPTLSGIGAINRLQRCILELERAARTPDPPCPQCAARQQHYQLDQS